jgi:GNAT superfamily N-acetyltransferase
VRATSPADGTVDRVADRDRTDAPSSHDMSGSSEPRLTRPGVTVERVDAAVTHPLRDRVLRPGRPPGASRFAVDDDARTACFAARTADGEVVGTAVVYPEPCPWLPDRPHAWRLRGMATVPGRRGQGIGAGVLRAGLNHVAAAGGRLVWCNARVPARRFYERAGFRPHGSPWDDPEIGPHVAMWLDLSDLEPTDLDDPGDVGVGETRDLDDPGDVGGPRDLNR